jgi:hypothetical protein
MDPKIIFAFYLLQKIAPEKINFTLFFMLPPCLVALFIFFITFFVL